MSAWACSVGNVSILATPTTLMVLLFSSIGAGRSWRCCTRRFLRSRGCPTVWTRSWRSPSPPGTWRVLPAPSSPTLQILLSPRFGLEISPCYYKFTTVASVCVRSLDTRVMARDVGDIYRDFLVAQYINEPYCWSSFSGCTFLSPLLRVPYCEGTRSVYFRIFVELRGVYVSRYYDKIFFPSDRRHYRVFFYVS